MTEAREVARALLDKDLACPAAVLVALVDDPNLKVKADVHYVNVLERAGCLAFGEVTPFGQHVAIVLRNVHGVEPWPRAGNA